MRIAKVNGYIGKNLSSFLSCEKDAEEIIRKLFVDNAAIADELKRLLVINTKDCIDNKTNQVYNEKIRKMTVNKLVEEGYVKLVPLFENGENQEAKSCIVITFHNFTPNASNEYYRDCTIMIDVLCDLKNWDIGNYRIRPIKIMGYIDSVLSGCRLSGIGTLQFIGAEEITLAEDFGGYCLMYSAVHGVDDALPVEEDDVDD